LSAELSEERPLVYLGLYDDMDLEVQSLLKKDGVTFNGGESSFTEVELEDIGNLNIKDSALFHLYQDRDGAYQLYILADSSSRLKGAIMMLLNEGPGECLVTPNTAFCEPEIPATDTPTPEPTSTPIPISTSEDDLEDIIGTPEPTEPPEPMPTETPAG
jgi:hypothetical protein